MIFSKTSWANMTISNNLELIYEGIKETNFLFINQFNCKRH